MTGSRSLLLSFQQLHGGSILYGNKGKGNIISKGNVQLNDFLKILGVNLVDVLHYNLLSVAQLCDQGDNTVSFTTRDVKVLSPEERLLLKGKRVGSSYLFDHDTCLSRSICLSTISADTRLWHKRLGHAILHLLSKLHKMELVRGLPRVDVDDMSSCDACSRGKMTRSSFPSKKEVSTTRPLDLIHMDLCGPMRVQSYGGNKYIFVLIDDYSRYTWTIFLRSKDQVFDSFHTLILMLENGYRTRCLLVYGDDPLGI